jgi:WD40 repeat protein
VWSTSSATATATRIGVIPTGHGSVSQLQFIEGTDDFLTSGRDGRLVRWTPAGHPDPIATFDQPIDKFARDPATGSIVVSTANGALWRTTAGGQARSLRSEGPRVNRLVDLPAQRTIYAGDARGDVVAIDTTSWQQETILHGSGAVAEIATTRDGRTLAVSTHDGAIQLGTRSGDAAHPGGITWRRLAVRAHQITLTSDGLLIASGSDGTIRLYSPARGRWLCVPTGTADLGRSAVTADGKAAVVLDFEGRMLWVDLEAARKQLEGAS